MRLLLLQGLKWLVTRLADWLFVQERRIINAQERLGG